MKALFQDKPSTYPKKGVNGEELKSLSQVLLDRRATSHFRPDPVPDEYIEAILQFGAQAPSGYNLQPWRFIVVREKENRERLKSAAYNQEKVAEAPVVIIAFAIHDDWKNYIDAVFEEGVRRGFGKRETVPEIKKQAAEFLEKGVPKPVWLNRHTMIAYTTMMLVAEAYGLDTAPMEGFDPAAVRREFGLPDNSEVVALLAVGYGQEPDKAYAGRFKLSEIVFEERFGRSWHGTGDGAKKSSPEHAVGSGRTTAETVNPT